MNLESIRGYAKALHALDRALTGHIDGEKQAMLFDRACENPMTASVEFFRLARANRVLDDETRRLFAEGLDMVDPDDVGDGRLSVEQQGDFILAWFRESHRDEFGRDRMPVGEAAQILGITSSAVSAAIARGDIKAEKVRGRWSVDSRSVYAYRDLRESQSA